MKLIGEAITRSTHSISHWVATLNHEVCDYAVKNSSVIKRLSCLLASDWVDPLPLSLRQLHKVGYGLWGMVWKELDLDIAFAGMQGRGRQINILCSQVVGIEGARITAQPHGARHEKSKKSQYGLYA